jgi:tRNA(adenine34) deaminase
VAFWVYILRCSDGSYYTGHTDDLDVRIGQHHAGLIVDCYTHDRRPLTLVYAQPFETREQALAAERQVKGWRRAKKEALIAGEFGSLPGLARTAQRGSGTSGVEARASTGSARTDVDVASSSESVVPTRPSESVRGEPVEPQCEALSGVEARASTRSARTDVDASSGSESTILPPSRGPVRGELVEPRCEASRHRVNPLPPKPPIGAAEVARDTAISSHRQPTETVVPSQIDIQHMQHALRLADRAEREDDEIPVGAVLVDAAGQVIAEGWNRNIAEHDPSAHAEIVALRAAGRALGNHRLVGTTLYVTLEPCAMCAMAIVHARVARLVYGASDPKTGACGSVFDLIADARHNHRVDVLGGVLGAEAGERLRAYFRRKRLKPGSAG